MWKNCEGFIFARTDWEYVTSTFIFPVNIGYHFVATKNGAMNGQLCGIGADAANRCIVVDEIEPMASSSPTGSSWPSRARTRWRS